jgi:UDP-2,3-diacylglucosamine pyrophosphatase LpxH
LAVLIFFANACIIAVKETQPFDSKKRTNELLAIHTSKHVCAEVPFNMKEAKIVFFSDLHRGMGEKDVFQNNSELFAKILNYYNENKYTLVLIGDVEEGWGFQGNNIPLILKWHNKEFEIEKKFNNENRLYRIYGNHDDYYRGNCLCSDCLGFTKIYPTIIFKDATNKFNMLITHGCQGHALHDAGDELARWGVYVKYNWLSEIFPKKFKTEKELEKEMKKIQDKYKKHEQYVYDWALDQKDSTGKKRYNLLILGHTHIPVFESEPLIAPFFDVLENDITQNRFIFFNDIFVDNKSDGANEPNSPMSPSLKKSMLESMKKYEVENNGSNSNGPNPQRTDPFYFNTGCAFLSKIPCVEITNGEIHLKFIHGFEDGKPLFDEPKEPAKLEKFL